MAACSSASEKVARVMDLTLRRSPKRWSPGAAVAPGWDEGTALRQRKLLTTRRRLIGALEQLRMQLAQ